MGYHMAGFEVTGVDIKPQKNYPFKFIQGDAIEYVKAYGHLYDSIHASPPCQHASKSTAPAKSKGKVYVDLIPATSEALSLFNVPTIIENVPGANIRPDIVLFGNMFGLKVRRKMVFEIENCFILQPGNVRINYEYVQVFGAGSWKKTSTGRKPEFAKQTVRETWLYAMGITHNMTIGEIAEAIPPAYTEFIGKQIINFLNNKTL